MAYLQRLLGDTLTRRSGVPVLVLEGARAVGKTTMMREQVMATGEYSYSSLADPATREFALRDLVGWVSRLPRPAIIDEAQLLPDLPLVLKELVDTLEPGTTHFVLTGSATIGRSGLGGADPLTRRSERLTMHPLTLWEKRSLTGSVVDALFDAEPSPGFHEELSDDTLIQQMTVGGFPTFEGRILTRREISRRVGSDVLAVLGDDLDPGSVLSTTTARSALDALLRTPGGIFNASRLGQTLGMDRRTVDRYMSDLERRFLLHWLPNRATTASRQNHSRAKIHPVDTSFSVESLARAGVDVLEQREHFGALLESHVVNQLVAAAGWSSLHAWSSYWRVSGSSGAEVDLVLEDTSGRLVGVEVKAAKSVSPKDIRGLQALRQHSGMHRGFVIYTGATTRQLDDDIWALPVSALSHAEAFIHETGRDRQTSLPRPHDLETIGMSSSTAGHAPATYDATIFLSYVHADDERAGGRIVRLAEDLVETYSYLYGRTLRIFVDRSDIRWGERWSDRLTNEIDSTTFLLSAVTPRYLMSTACREEVAAFTAAAKRAQDTRLLLPLIWVDVASTDVVAPDDPVRVALMQNQFLEIPELRRLEHGSSAYEDALETVARRLKETIDHHVKPPKGSLVSGESTTESSDEDLLSVMQALEEDQDGLEGAAKAFGTALGAVGNVVMTTPSTPPGASAAIIGKHLAELGERLAGPVSLADEATAALGRAWQAYETPLSRIVGLLSDTPDDARGAEISETLRSLDNVLDMPQLDVLEQQLTRVSTMSRHLRPLSQSISNAATLIRGIRSSVQSWRAQL